MNTGRRFFLFFFLGAALLAGLTGLSGCGDGETLPLYPAANVCDRPPDPHWQIVSPLAGDRIPLDGLWTEQEEVCVVGSRGLGMFKSNDEPFVRLDAPTPNNLVCVAALEDLEDQAETLFLAVGTGGTIVEGNLSAGTGWQVKNSPTTADLNLVITRSGEAWAVGRQGTVLGRAVDGNWTDSEFPGSTSLAGADVRGDTLAVCGDQGQLWFQVDGQWLDPSAGPWQDENLHSVVWLPDGRLLAIGEEFYLRGEEGWQLAPMEQGSWMRPTFRAWYQAGRLYVDYRGGSYTLNPMADDWNPSSFSYSQFGTVAARDSLSHLVINRSRELVWLRDGQYGEYDLAGVFDNGLFQLEDGTYGIFDGKGLLMPGPQELRRVVTFPDETLFSGYVPRNVIGASLDDFYFDIRNELWRMTSGQTTLVAALPDGYIRDIVIDGQGLIHLAYYDGIWTWDGVQLVEAYYEDNLNPVLSVTAHGTAVARRGSRIFYYQEAGWIPLESLGSWLGGEAVPGDLFFLRGGDNNLTSIWRKGVGLVAEGSFLPMPGCPDLDFDFGVDHELGLHIVSDKPSFVLRLNGDPLLGNWDLVAGPIEYEINAMAVGADGSLLAKETQTQSVLYYQAR